MSINTSNMITFEEFKPRNEEMKNALLRENAKNEGRDHIDRRTDTGAGRPLKGKLSPKLEELLSKPLVD